jgi:hypothetical protein
MSSPLTDAKRATTYSLLLLSRRSYSHIDMNSRRPRASLRNLIKKTACLGRRRHRSETARPPTPKEEHSGFDAARLNPLSALCRRRPNMAEEEDFSSLPLTDRWVHKVCLRLRIDQEPH